VEQYNEKKQPLTENQYDTPTEATIPVPQKSPESKSIDDLDRKVKMLEDQITELYQNNMRLHRQITRLKDDISDIVTTLRNRG
jgi:predicted RNase H-like nuclease (RuvC/YqgF family)